MEDKRNQLVVGQAKLDVLVLQLEREQTNLNIDGSSIKSIESLTRQVNEQRNIVVYLKFAVDEGNSKFERVHKQAIDAHSNLGALEKRAICRQHENVILNLLMKCVKGTSS